MWLPLQQTKNGSFILRFNSPKWIICNISKKKCAQKNGNEHQTNNNNNNVLNFSFIFISASCVVCNFLFRSSATSSRSRCVCVFFLVSVFISLFFMHLFSYLLNARSHFDCAVQNFSRSSFSFLVCCSFFFLFLLSRSLNGMFKEERF